jgi:hypothetical protein
MSVFMRFHRQLHKQVYHWYNLPRRLDWLLCLLADAFTDSNDSMTVQFDARSKAKNNGHQKLPMHNQTI